MGVDEAGHKTKKPPLRIKAAFLFGDPAGIRTQDPYIKSVLLYQLSYGIIMLLNYFHDLFPNPFLKVMQS